MRAPLVSRLAAVAITAASSACGDSFTTHGISEPDLLEIQASRDWTEPGDTIVVRLRAKVQGGEDGFGIPGIVLRVLVTRGGGSVWPDSVITDQDGAASVQWVVGSVED